MGCGTTRPVHPISVSVTPARLEPFWTTCLESRTPWMNWNGPGPNHHWYRRKLDRSRRNPDHPAGCSGEAANGLPAVSQLESAASNWYRPSRYSPQSGSNLTTVRHHTADLLRIAIDIHRIQLVLFEFTRPLVQPRSVTRNPNAACRYSKRQSEFRFGFPKCRAGHTDLGIVPRGFAETPGKPIRMTRQFPEAPRRPPGRARVNQGPWWFASPGPWVQISRSSLDE